MRHRCGKALSKLLHGLSSSQTVTLRAVLPRLAGNRCALAALRHRSSDGVGTTGNPLDGADHRLLLCNK